MRTTITAIGYTVLNVRYVSFVLPVGVLCYLVNRPAWLIAVLAGLLVLAFAAELFASTINGMTAASQVSAQRQQRDDMWDQISKYANGGWVGLDGSEGEAGTPEGQAGPTEEDGEGGTPVPARQ